MIVLLSALGVVGQVIAAALLLIGVLALFAAKIRSLSYEASNSAP